MEVVPAAVVGRQSTRGWAAAICGAARRGKPVGGRCSGIGAGGGRLRAGMAYRSLAEAVSDLERNRMLVRVPDEVDGHLEAAEIQRRVHAARGPAVLYERVRGSESPCVSNLFGTPERARFLLRHGLEAAKAAVRYRAEPARIARDLGREPRALLRAADAGIHSLPRRVHRPPSQAQEIPVDAIPRITSWPDDGGPFITLPQVFTEAADARPGPLGAPLASNVGMYRIQLAGGEYGADEAGMHYQIHRGIGVHHTEAERRGEPLRVSVFVGGPPAHTLAAVMPLPEGLSELLFAGMLAGRRFGWYRRDDGFVVSADADFTITGFVEPGRTLPEGPFGDHLGYYSLTHPFPALRVTRVTRRKDAVWPFTVVGRPPQEDTTFGQLIHEITEPMVPTTLPGVHSIHAVDAAGVHPLLFAVGSERYSPFTGRRPQELWTIANAILGFGQCSLAKYLFIAAKEDDPDLHAGDIAGMLGHVLRRVDLGSDLHFQTRTTIDTLDYSGEGLNAGSKLVIAGAGPERRKLFERAPDGVAAALPATFSGLTPVLPGVFVLGGPRFDAYDRVEADLAPLWEALDAAERDGADLSGMPLFVLCDDARFAAETLRNFLWVTFTRSNPSHDVHGRRARIHHKHWSAVEPLLVDARLKPHHAPPLIEDPAVTRRVNELGAPGGPLHGLI